jgi:hypothetical protein
LITAPGPPRPGTVTVVVCGMDRGGVHNPGTAGRWPGCGVVAVRAGSHCQPFWMRVLIFRPRMRLVVAAARRRRRLAGAPGGRGAGTSTCQSACGSGRGKGRWCWMS